MSLNMIQLYFAIMNTSLCVARLNVCCFIRCVCCCCWCVAIYYYIARCLLLLFNLYNMNDRTTIEVKRILYHLSLVVVWFELCALIGLFFCCSLFFSPCRSNRFLCHSFFRFCSPLARSHFLARSFPFCVAFKIPVCS